MSKCCRTCHTIKPNSDFRVKTYKSGNTGIGAHCKKCLAITDAQSYLLRKSKIRLQQKASYLANTESYRARSLKNNFNISISDYASLLQKQGNVCAICKGVETEKLNGKIKKLTVDHCHQSGKVRGLLCTKCNRGLGMFKDDTHVMNQAIQYLERKEFS